MSNVIDLGKHMPRNKSDHDLKEVKQDDGTTIWTITISGMSDDEWKYQEALKQQTVKDGAGRR